MFDWWGAVRMSIVIKMSWEMIKWDMNTLQHCTQLRHILFLTWSIREYNLQVLTGAGSITVNFRIQKGLNFKMFNKNKFSSISPKDVFVVERMLIYSTFRQNFHSDDFLCKTSGHYFVSPIGNHLKFRLHLSFQLLKNFRYLLKIVCSIFDEQLVKRVDRNQKI